MSRRRGGKGSPTAIPGGGTGKNSAFLFRTPDGYSAVNKMTFNGAVTSNPDMQAAADLLNSASGTSIFDPVLCELAYRWFCPPGGSILDPFAGGSVRGIVASKLGHPYTGIDLSARQLAANRQQAATICADGIQPDWIHGDSTRLDELIQPGAMFDMVFSCPPYGSLEVYSNDAADLSTMGYAQFRQAYNRIIAAAVERLKPNRFAAFVVGDFRDSSGFYQNFPGHTADAFIAAGAGLYNEAILVTAIGSLPVRTQKMFEASRKLGKTHQNLLIFCKGDPKRAAAAIGNET